MRRLAWAAAPGLLVLLSGGARDRGLSPAHHAFAVPAADEANTDGSFTYSPPSRKR